MPKKAKLEKPMSKSALYADIAETTELSKKQVAEVFDALADVIQRHLKKRGGVEQFTLPGLLKVKTVKKPARPARKGVPNPFKPGELMDVAAKPASVKVKITPLKKLKDMAL
ncbi:MAG: HU family DNA-binding protein [Myxococcota bacterium]